MPYFYVAPFTGAWIEITRAGEPAATVSGAPFTGAWIEMPTFCVMPVM